MRRLFTSFLAAGGLLLAPSVLLADDGTPKVYISQDYEAEGVEPDWTTSSGTRFVPVIMEDGQGGHFLSVDQATRGQNGSTQTGKTFCPEDEQIVGPGVDFTLSFDMKLCNSNYQAPASFFINDWLGNDWSAENKVFDLSSTDSRVSTWVLNGGDVIDLPGTGYQGSTDINDASIPWYTVVLTRKTYGDKVISFVSITSKADANAIITKKVVPNMSENGGLGWWIADMRRFNANFALDNILVREVVDDDAPAGQPLTWTIKYQSEAGDSINTPIESLGFAGDAISAYEEQAADFFDSEGRKWIYVSGNDEKVLSAEDNVITLVFRPELPTPVATLTGAEVGFNKTYQISVDNSDVPTKPTLGYKYAIYDANGVLVETNGNLDSDATNGTSLTLGKGTLELWSVCDGFVESNHVFITNDTPYTLDEENDVLDFQHYTAEQITSLGFEFTDLFESTTMSGENNWVARCRIYDFILKDGADINNPQVGDTLVFEDRYTGQAPAGAYTFPSLNRWGYPDWATDADSIKAYSLFPHLGLWWKDRLGGKEMGLNFTEQIGFYSNTTRVNALHIYLHGLSDDDMTLVYTMNNYGANSVHNLVFSEEAAKAANHAPITHVIKGNGSFTIERISESVAKVEFLKPGNPERVASPIIGGTVTAVDKVVSNKQQNDTIYDLRGVKVNKDNLAPGLYIQNGKLLIVK